LSGGQRQRVALGRAIVREPAVFLMDEPLSNLDAKLRVQTRAEIARLHQRLGTTTVYVTHDQVEAMTMGERIAVMSEARLQQVGSPQALYDHPDNRFVAGFIGSPSMNFLEVDVTRTGDAVQLKGDGIDIPLPDRYTSDFKSFSGNKLVAGVRPEHLDVTAEGASGSLSGNADVVEYLGNEELIHLSVGGHDIVALIGSEHRVKPGDDLTLHISLDKVHGVRAASVSDPYSAERAIKSNDARVLCLGAQVVGESVAPLLVDHWLAGEFNAGRSGRKVAKIEDLDERERGSDPIGVS
jgi:multiple sugar transport system ATP-binding protein